MKYHSTNHLMHLLITIVTTIMIGPWWLIVWVYCSISNSQKNKKAEYENRFTYRPRY